MAKGCPNRPALATESPGGGVGAAGLSDAMLGVGGAMFGAGGAMFGAGGTGGSATASDEAETVVKMLRSEAAIFIGVFVLVEVALLHRRTH